MRQALEPAVLHLFDHAALLENGDDGDVLPTYRQQVLALRDVAREHHMNGLAYVGMLLDDGLARLVAQHRALTPDERAALADWPALVMTELFGMAQNEQPATWAVLHSMRRHPWFPELPDYFWHVIENRLCEDARALETDVAPSQKDQVLAMFVPAGTTEPADDDLVILGGEDDAVVCDIPCDPPGDTPRDTHVVAWDELAVLGEAVGALKADGAALLLDETTPRADLFERYTEQLANLVNAAKVVGLGGFQQVLELVLANTTSLRCSGQPLGPEQRDLLARWPQAAMAYLAAPADPQAAQELAYLAADGAWPFPAELDDLAGWVHAMCSVQAVEARAAAPRPRAAGLDDMDLRVPGDIETNVLDSLLLELPQHAQEFSQLVQQIAAGGTLEQLEDARRVAHTLKGAGHTVGIRGVANLTHALEDILMACGRAQRLPPPDLAQTLIEAADCLEAMSEAVLAGEASLPESVAVHQRVLAWAQRIDTEGLPEAEDMPSAGNPAVPEAEAAAPTAADANDPLLRVPASLIDALLLLVGENSILSSQIQDRVGHLSQDLNALRGGSRQFSKLSYELEQLVDVRGGAMLSGRKDDFDALEMDQYNDLHMLSRRIVESDADSREFTRGFEREVNGLRDLLAEKERVQLEIQRKVLRTRMVEVASIAPRLQRTLRQTARVLGRSVQLVIDGESTLVDRQLLQRLVDPLMHLLRNAVDHGIEPADERLRAGKPANGSIRLRFAAEGTSLRVNCTDDGRGLDVAAIAAKARSVGLVAPQAVLTDEQTLRLILLPGFSTRDHATQISGRGVGMDVVHRTVVDLRGTLEIQSRSGLGARFDMLFPMQLSSTQVMITRSPRHMLAISVRGVDQILPVGTDLKTDSEGRLRFLMQGEPLNAMRLEVLLGLPAQAFVQPGAIEVVMIVRDENRLRHALVVPELRDSRNVVVKPFPAIVPRHLGVDGATILGDGAVAMVLDLPDLLRGHRLAGAPQQAGLPPMPVLAPQRCLIVDDSVSVRQSMEQLMQDAGYEVSTARDGIEALGAVQRSRPDIVLVDLEMPRMNGLELTTALRNQAATRAVPVVMITSRFTDKHRQLAIAAGVNAFLTKPYAEDHLLGTVEKLLPRGEVRA